MQFNGNWEEPYAEQQWQEPQWPQDGGAGMGYEDPGAFGLVDIGKGKSKGGGKMNTWEWDDSGSYPAPSFGEPKRQAVLGAASFKSPGMGVDKGKGGVWRTPADGPYPKADAFKGGLSGKAAPGALFAPDPNGKGGKPGPGFSYKGKIAPRKAPPGSGGVPVPPPSSFGGKGAPTMPGVGPVRMQGPPLTPLDGAVRAPAVVPRPFRGDAPGYAPKTVSAPPRMPMQGATIRPPGALPALGAQMVPGMRGMMPQSRSVFPPTRAPMLGGTPPPPGGMPMMGGQVMPKYPGALANAPHTVLPQGAGLAPELAALVNAEGDQDPASTRLGPMIPEKKPRIFLLVTKLAPELEEGHMQQIMEQCGEVQAFRRGRDNDGKPLSFGFAQFGDPEAAWKASTCLSKRVLCGSEIKVLVEEQAEVLIQAWRRSQQIALRVSTDEELEWELERKAVSCKACIDAKVEELFGAPQDGSGSAIAQRRQELRERERKRMERLKKRKAWRDEEFARELARVESAEKRQRREEVDKDDGDRLKEEVELRQKEEGGEPDLPLASMEDAPPSSASRPKATPHADNRKLATMVDAVQTEPRDDLFRMELNVGYLRNERILETKLRPWLERKVDISMGGPQSDLVEYILRKINGSYMPDTLISELTRYLDDNAEPIVERIWRMLAFELMRGGVASLNSATKRESKLQ